jgi:PAS domain S-box-containing protein
MTVHPDADPIHRIEEPQDEKPLRRKVNAAFAVALLITVLLSSLSWHNSQQAQEDADWVARAHEVSNTLETTLRQLVDVETGARGFALTGHEVFLEPYETGKYAVSQDLFTLSVLTVDLDQKLRLALLVEQANAGIAADSELVALRRNSGTVPSIAQIEHGKKLMDALRVTIDTMEAGERRLLEQRTNRARRAHRLTILAIWLGAVLGLFFLFIAAIAVNREITVSAKARAQVSTLNADLERGAEQRQRLAAVIDSSDDAIIAKDLNGKIYAWNRGAEKVFGYSASEAVGKSMLMLLPPKRVSEESDILERIRRGERVEHFETIRVRKDGTSINISATISPIQDSGGAIVGASKIARDITKRKQVEEELRESEARFRLFIEHAPVALAMFDRDMRYLHLSRRWRDDYGLGDRDLRGLSHYEVFPEVPDRWREAHRRGLAGEVLRSVEDRFERSDESVQWLRWEIRPWRDETGEIGGIVVFTEDVSERKQAQEAVHESEERFHAMLNGIPQLAWMAEADGHIFWYNQRWYEYTGTSFEQMEGWGWQSVHDPEFLPKVQEKWNASLAEGTAFEMEFPLRAADGSFGTFLTRIVPLKDENGRVLRWFGTNTDVSERTRAEQRLTELALELSHRAEELASSRKALEAQTVMFQLVLASMGEGLIAADLQGHFLIFNDAAHDLMGRGPEDLPTKEWTGHYKVFLPDGITPYPPDGLPLVRAIRGESVQVELIVQHPDTMSSRSLEVTARPLRDSRGSRCGGVAVLHDVTERKRSDGELARQAVELLHSRQDLETQTLMLQSVLDSVSEGLVVADEEGKVIIWNPAAERIVGLGAANLSPDEWSAHYGAYLPDTVTPLPAEQNPLLRAVRGEVSSAEIFFRNPELRSEVWIECNGCPLRDKNGVLRGGVIAFRDITQKKIAELEIRKLNEHLEQRIAERTVQLETANHELEAFTYSISHDLRAPLRHIAGFSGRLSKDFASSMAPEAREYLQLIENGTRHMNLMVSGLLDLAKLGQRPLQRSLTELNPIVDRVILLLRPEYDGRDVEWRIARLPAIDCDPILIGQVFQNLLSNALKYSGRRTTAVIEIGSIQQQGNPPVIFVRDNGAGFDMQHASMLFGVFQRMHTDAEFEGIGVGLSTVHRIIQKHGGSIWAEAEPGHGATFYFTVGVQEPPGIRQRAMEPENSSTKDEVEIPRVAECVPGQLTAGTRNQQRRP